ncbi:tyrosine-type recombinase/integrase [Candidatus Hecatella orcuttiae]|uniref:tyrosine-type recombinase/integrase n=1 Tax=Candidatus Hecatella orcuttiae TaxID=1935119 RepID=UPI002867D773|nr:tyrosine-type recombinase/integrase [Candidatus Hecatella orcuttiae]
MGPQEPGGEAVERWFERLAGEHSGSPNTRRAYGLWLRRFCGFVKMSPDELVERRRRELEAKDEAVRRRMEERLTAWFNHLQRREGLRRSSAAFAHAAVRSFFTANYLPLKVKAPQSWTETASRVPSREELRAMCDLADPRGRAYVLCQAQSGLSEADLLALTYGAVKTELEAGKRPVYLRLRRQKTQGWFETFLGRDACSALQAYFQEDGKPSAEERVFPISDRTARRLVTGLAAEAGVDGQITCHSLRKWFNTMAKLAGVNEAVVEYMMGHSLGRLRVAYFIPPRPELERAYLKAEPYLSPYGPERPVR